MTEQQRFVPTLGNIPQQLLREIAERTRLRCVHDARRPVCRECERDADDLERLQADVVSAVKREAASPSPVVTADAKLQYMADLLDAEIRQQEAYASSEAPHAGVSTAEDRQRMHREHGHAVGVLKAFRKCLELADVLVPSPAPEQEKPQLDPLTHAALMELLLAAEHFATEESRPGKRLLDVATWFRKRGFQEA